MTDLRLAQSLRIPQGWRAPWAPAQMMMMSMETMETMGIGDAAATSSTTLPTPSKPYAVGVIPVKYYYYYFIKTY